MLVIPSGARDLLFSRTKSNSSRDGMTKASLVIGVQQRISPGFSPVKIDA